MRTRSLFETRKREFFAPVRTPSHPRFAKKQSGFSLVNYWARVCFCCNWISQRSYFFFQKGGRRLTYNENGIEGGGRGPPLSLGMGATEIDLGPSLSQIGTLYSSSLFFQVVSQDNFSFHEGSKSYVSTLMSTPSLSLCPAGAIIAKLMAKMGAIGGGGGRRRFFASFPPLFPSPCLSSFTC